MKHGMKALLAAALLSAACQSELDGKPAAKVAEAKTDAKAASDAKAPGDAKAAEPAAERKLKVDPATSSIGYVGRKITADHAGDFKTFTGEAVVDAKGPKSVAFTVETASVTADSEDLAKHLKTADFFDVEKFPRAEFKSTAITAKPGEKGATHEIVGDLELHGVKKSITFPATVTVDDRGAKGTAEFTINRKDFGIVYPGKPDDLIKDEVLLKLNLSFVP
jgi:polyisoprenoid-binding protein YceI